MTSPQSPVIIRQATMQRWTPQSGFRAYHPRYLFNAVHTRIGKFNVWQLCFVLLALAGIDYGTYVLADECVYKPFQNWAFDQSIAGRTDTTFVDYLSQRTFFGFLVRGSREHTTPARAQHAMVTAPAPGTVLGHLEIPRLHLTALVRQGVDKEDLQGAIGHVPATALAGQRGNFALAAHHDINFRALKNIGNGDLVTFQAQDGSNYQYRVAATQIIKPSDASVLRADGGGLITDSGSVQSIPKLLTVITRYPFSYVGSAPKRFVIEARLVEMEGLPKETIPATASDQDINAPEPQTKPGNSVHHSKARAHRTVHRRRASKLRRVANKSAARSSIVSDFSAKPVKKKRFWRKLF